MFEHGDQFGHGVHFAFSFLVKKLLALEAALATIGHAGRHRFRFRGQLVKPLAENGFDRVVLGTVVGQRTVAGGLQPLRAVFADQPDHPLGCPEMIDHPVAQQLVDQAVAAGADLPGLLETPLGIAHQVGDGVRRQVVDTGGFLARPGTAGMGRHQLMLMVDFDGGFRRLDPQFLVDQLEGGRVVGLLELEMAVAVQLVLGPDRQLRSHGGQGLEEGLLRLGEHHQRLLLGGAVDPVAGRFQHPLLELAVGVDQIAELTQGQEVVFDVLDPGLHPRLHLRLSRRTVRDQKAVAFGKLGVGTVHRRIVPAGLDDPGLEVVDHHLGRHPAEELEGPAVTAQPGRHLLVADDLGVLVPAEGQGHDEYPGGKRLAGMGIKQLGAGTEIHLGRFAGIKIQHHRGLRVIPLEGLEQTSDRGVTVAETVFAHQGLVHGGAVDPGRLPGLELLPVR